MSIVKNGRISRSDQQTVRSDLVPETNQFFLPCIFGDFEPFPKDLGTIIQHLLPRKQIPEMMLFWIYLLSNMAILGNVKFQCGIYYKVDVSGPGKPTHTNQQAARWVAFSAHVARCVSTTSTISQLCSPCRLGMATRLAAAFSKTLRNVLTLGIQSPCQMMIGVRCIICIVTSSARYLGSIHFSIPAPSSRGAN